MLSRSSTSHRERVGYPSRPYPWVDSHLYDPHVDDEIAQMYEYAIEKNPSNEELYLHVFMAHVRGGNAKAQQQVALRISKLFKANRYVFWTIMSLVQQVRRSSGRRVGVTM